jgi:MYXO-CTERM domain-containing protein
MIRKTIAGLSLVAIVATSASAQAFVQDNFQIISFTGGSGYNSATGKFTADAFNTGTSTTLSDAASATYLGVPFSGAVSSPFRFWCVDFADVANFGDPTAWVTPFNSSAFSTHTFISGGNSTGTGGVLGTFEKAVWLIGQENNIQQGTGSSYTTAGTGYGVMDYQEAIWKVMGYSPSMSANANSLYTDLGSANLGYVDLTQWDVINSFTGSGQYTTYSQEFVYCESGGPNSTSSLAGCFQTPGTPQSVTPEPTTVSLIAFGLAGLAGPAIRRRRRQLA